jgi:hypothetical protein
MRDSPLALLSLILLFPLFATPVTCILEYHFNNVNCTGNYSAIYSYRLALCNSNHIYVRCNLDNQSEIIRYDYSDALCYTIQSRTSYFMNKECAQDSAETSIYIDCEGGAKRNNDLRSILLLLLPAILLLFVLTLA